MVVKPPGKCQSESPRRLAIALGGLLLASVRATPVGVVGQPAVGYRDLIFKREVEVTDPG
jgi:hypothetical protein